MFLLSWYVTEWTPCSKTCGRGLQSRKVICQQKVSSKETLVVPDSTCPADTKPFLSSESEYCNVILCPANWVVISDWSKVRYRPVMPGGTALPFLYQNRDSWFVKINLEMSPLTSRSSPPPTTPCVTVPTWGRSIKYLKEIPYMEHYGKRNLVQKIISSI